MQRFAGAVFAQRLKRRERQGSGKIRDVHAGDRGRARTIVRDNEGEAIAGPEPLARRRDVETGRYRHALERDGAVVGGLHRNGSGETLEEAVRAVEPREPTAGAGFARVALVSLWPGIALRACGPGWSLWAWC